MTTHRRTAAAAVLALVLPLPIVAAGAASAAPVPAASSVAAPVKDGVQLELPRPTGPHAVGTSTLHLVDANRQDPWVPAAGPRQLMVSMYYPARPGTGRPAPYMTTQEAQVLLDMEAPGSGVPAEYVADARTHAYSAARPEHGRFPLVVLSPGFKLPRTTLTGLAVDLASHGYVVALVNHTYEDSGTTFPDGRTLGCAICGASAPAPATVTASRAQDVSFVLDRLTGPQPSWQYAHLIDPHRIGMAGHSIGGTATIPTMATDRRVRAGIDLDGAIDPSEPVTGLDGRPLLLMGNPVNHTVDGDEPSWGTAWPSLDGWKRWLTVTGTTHFDFTDVPVLGAQLGLPTPGEEISAPRALELTRTYVTAFFDLHLKGIPQPLLDGPSPADPEVVFQHP